jgi:hypothetical protein
MEHFALTAIWCLFVLTGVVIYIPIMYWKLEFTAV